MVSLIIFCAAEAIFLLNLLREIFVFKDIKSCFYCGHCNTFNEEISRIGKCKKCHRTIKIKGNTWDHMLLHRVNWIPAKSKGEVFKWKDYKKLSIIEITVNCIAMFIIFIGILTEIL